jgi:hypothetical protein
MCGVITRVAAVVRWLMDFRLFCGGVDVVEGCCCWLDIVYLCAHPSVCLYTQRREEKTMQQHAHAVIVFRCLEQIVVRPEDTEESKPLRIRMA